MEEIQDIIEAMKSKRKCYMVLKDRIAEAFVVEIIEGVDYIKIKLALNIYYIDIDYFGKAYTSYRTVTKEYDEEFVLKNLFLDKGDAQECLKERLKK